VADRLTPFGKYFLLERINVGGMAEVYKAKTVGVEGFEKIVAIKRILPSVAEDEEFIKMFVDEAKITSQLSHANLAQTFDLGKIDDTFYIAMEYVPGKDLRAVFERMNRRGERMPLVLAAYVLARVCDGLDYAHRKRDPSGRDLHIVHRDVSPQNIILSYEGEVKLIDFGIAKAANKITKTQAGILKGKFGYMSPEQVRGLALDGRSDIFAAGVVLYELCTGERLFTGASDFSVLEKVQQAKVPPPSQVEPSIPLKLERIILKALSREPEDRYQQAADFAHDLTRFLLDTQHKAVTREDAAAFMKATFPDEREEISRPVRRPPPRISEPPRKRADEETRPSPDGETRKGRDAAHADKDRTEPRADEPAERPRRSAPPPPLPSSLTEGLPTARPSEHDPERTQLVGTPHEAPTSPKIEERAEIIVRSKLPPLPQLGPLPAAPSTKPPAPEARGFIEQSDGPTRPMSMDELAKAERDFIERERHAKGLGSGENTPTPEGPPAPEALADAREEPALPATGGARGRAVEEEPTRTPVDKPDRPPPKPRSTPPPLPSTLLEGTQEPGAKTPSQPEPPRRRNGLGSRSSKPRLRPPPPQLEKPAGPPSPPAPVTLEKPALEPPAAEKPPVKPLALEDQKTQLKRAPNDPFQGRMQRSKPMLLGEDPLPAGEITSSNVTPRARWIRRAQYAIVLAALGIAAWAVLSTPRPRSQPAAVEGTGDGSLAVTVDPADSQLLLDGALVKDASDAQWSAQKITAGSEHVLTARRDGYTEQTVPLTLKPGEQKNVSIQLAPSMNEIAVLSSPAGAQVYLDGVRKGVTPAFVGSIDSKTDHAVTVEKKCYRAWQIALPARAGRRQIAATLQPQPGACPGHHLETSGMPAPEGLPDEAAASATLGFLNLGSRPSAQVLIDGVDLGQTTPLLAWPLKNGNHHVTLVAPGRSKELSVDIRVGETHSEIVDLSPAAKKRGRR